MTNATKPTGKAATLAQVKAYLSASDIESQFQSSTGTLLAWYEIDDNEQPVNHTLSLRADKILHVELTSIGDVLVAEYDSIEYALISTGLRLCSQEAAPAFIETYAKPYEAKQNTCKPSDDSDYFKALSSLATYTEELRTALAAARQMLEYQDPFFYQTTLGAQIGVLSGKRNPVLDHGNLIDSVNRESIIRGSELYAAARALAHKHENPMQLVADVIQAVNHLDSNANA